MDEKLKNYVLKNWDHLDEEDKAVLRIIGVDKDKEMPNFKTKMIPLPPETEKLLPEEIQLFRKFIFSRQQEKKTVKEISPKLKKK